MNFDKSQTFVISESDAGLRLDKWLAAPERLGSRSRALAAIDHGKIFLDDKEQSAADSGRRLVAGESLRIWIDRPGSSQRRYSERHASDLHILYEDSCLLVINKPPGLLSVPLAAQPEAPSLLDMVRKHLRSKGKMEPLVVHRIDRDTSGIVLFAKSSGHQKTLKDQFERREIERTYLAIVHGIPSPQSGTWQDRLVWDKDELLQKLAERNDRMAKEASCRYKVIEKYSNASMLEVSLITGKRNQIRIQAGLHGHPIIGEKMYVYSSPPPNAIDFSRQALHAFKLKFKHPVDSRVIDIEAPLPEDLNSLIAKLKRVSTKG